MFRKAMEKQKTVLNVVLHQGGGNRFGVICGEYKKSPASSVRIKNLIPGEEWVLDAKSCYYKNGSIYSEKISDWLFDHGYFRMEDYDDMPLFKFFFERKGEEDIYEYAGFSGYLKEPNRHILKTKDDKTIPYKKEDLLDIVWGDKVIEGESDTEIKTKKTSDEKKDAPVSLIPTRWAAAISIAICLTFGIMWSIVAGILLGAVTWLFFTKYFNSDNKAKAFIIYALCIAFLIYMCRPTPLLKDTIYSCPEMHLVKYFKYDKDNDIVFGEKTLGAIAVYKLRNNSIYDKRTGAKVGHLKRTFLGIKVEFDNPITSYSLDGTYKKDH